MIWICAAFVFSIITVPLAAFVARRIGFLDRPGENTSADDKRVMHKHHDGAVPPVGGLVLVPVFIGVLFAAGAVGGNFAAFAMALIMAMLVGAWDDRAVLSPYVIFAAQWCIAAIIVLWGGAHIGGVGPLFGGGEIVLGVFDIPVSMLAVVVLMNAINFMDGLDGLAGGLGVVILGWFMWLSGGGDAVFQMAVFMAALLGVWVYNVRILPQHRARVFLGNTGSMVLGVGLSWFALCVPETVSPVNVAWVLALPVFDLCAQFIRRVVRRQNPFKPDRHHIHYRLVDAGVPVSRAVWVIIIATFVSGGIGVLLVMVFGSAVAGLSWVVAFVLYVVVCVRGGVKALRQPT